MKEESAKQEHTIEDYKKWFNQECEENLKLKEEIRKLKEFIKAQAVYIANL